MGEPTEINEEELAEIERLWKAATHPNVGGLGYSAVGHRVYSDNPWCEDGCCESYEVADCANGEAADFVAACYPTIPRLVAALSSARTRLAGAEAALSACAGFLTSLRDDAEYDFSLAHSEQIGRLCQLVWRALAHPTTEEPTE